ncbi:MAG TPA: metallophosphoesterase [Chitinophagales bacterium]|nr:metallophosphoesterase [Chitinophagales bacterium]
MRWIITCLFLLISAQWAWSQTHIREYSINKNKPNAQYKFTFVHLTDTHIGEGESDYGTPGFQNDTMPEGDVGRPAIRLRRAIQWINNNRLEHNIKFVIVTGDITDSGERSEFEKAKEILDALEIPYLPILGNHDVWPYVSYQNEAPYAYGDSVMNEVFKETFERCSQFFDDWNDGFRLTRVYSPASQQEHYFHNYSFSYDGFGFIAVDFNPRHHVEKAEPGVGGYARLNDFDQGSYPWLLDQVKHHPAKGDKNLILLSHQPPHRDFLSWYNGLPLQDVDQLTQGLLPYKDHLALWLAGHVHRNRIYPLTTIGSGIKIMDVKETPANKEFSEGYLSLIHAYEIPIATSIHEEELSKKITIYPNPAEDYLHVILPDNFKTDLYSIYNVDGKKILTKHINPGQQNLSLPISELPNGMYIIQFKFGEQLVMKNFIKNN